MNRKPANPAIGKEMIRAEKDVAENARANSLAASSPHSAVNKSDCQQ
jgi:hypothetical protein